MWLDLMGEDIVDNEFISIITKCRVCASTRLNPVFEMGLMPLANALRLDKTPNQRYPLTLLFCEECSLVQLRETIDPRILFSADYLYYSSQSETMVRSAKDLVVKILRDNHLEKDELVMEAASNDGYLLQHYVNAGVQVLGVDPAEKAASLARRIGVNTDSEFFTAKYAERHRNTVTIFHANNVLAHVQNQNDFVRGINIVLKDDGLAVIEVPYLGNMISHREFDTIYHEHLCYFSLTALQRLCHQNNLLVWKVDELPIHGGSLRVFLRKDRVAVDPSVRHILRREQQEGMHLWRYYADFGARANLLGNDLWRLFDRIHRGNPGARIAGYGAAAKGNQLLSYFDIDFLAFVMDSTPAKQLKLMSGVDVPIIIPDRGIIEHLDYIIILAWNFKDEIMAKHPEFKGKWIVPIPDVQLI